MERLHQFHVRGAAHSGDFRSEVPRELHRIGADAAGRAVDKHPLSALNVADIPEEEQCGRRPDRSRGRLLEGHSGGFYRQRAVFAHALVLGIRAEAKTCRPENLVADSEPFDVLSGRFDLTGQLESKDGVSGSTQAKY